MMESSMRFRCLKETEAVLPLLQEYVEVVATACECSLKEVLVLQVLDFNSSHCKGKKTMKQIAQVAVCTGEVGIRIRNS